MITFAVCGMLALMGLVLFLVLGVPFLIILGFAPWALGVVGVILLVRALFERPLTLENFTPAGIALAASLVLRWIL